MLGKMEYWNVGHGKSETTGYLLPATLRMNVWLYAQSSRF